MKLTDTIGMDYNLIAKRELDWGDMLPVLMPDPAARLKITGVARYREGGTWVMVNVTGTHNLCTHDEPCDAMISAREADREGLV